MKRCFVTTTDPTKSLPANVLHVCMHVCHRKLEVHNQCSSVVREAKQMDGISKRSGDWKTRQCNDAKRKYTNILFALKKVFRLVRPLILISVMVAPQL